MKLNPFANVTILVSGLAVCHYNKASKAWEFLLPRQVPDHNLKIIFTKYFKNGNVTTRDIGVAESVKNISVETRNVFEPSAATEFNHISGAEKDDRDARWILDIAELYKKPVKLRNINNKAYTYLKIPAGTLYVEKFPLKPSVEIINSNGSKQYKRVAQTAGIDIQWQPGTGSTIVKDDADNEELIMDVLHTENVASYIIEFNNDCPRICLEDETDYKHYNEDLIDLKDKFTINSILSFPSNSLPISPIGETLFSMFSKTMSPLFCGDAPCFLVECSNLDGINSLADLVVSTTL